MSELRLAAGKVLFQPQDTCPGFVVVQSGCIRVSLLAANGREIVLYRVRAGDICLQTFTCLVQGRVYSATGVVEEALVGDLISPERFNTKLAEDAQFRAEVFEAIAHRFGDFEQLVEDVALSGLAQRLARSLLRLVTPHMQATISITHERLAVEVGSGRAAVSRQLEAFAHDGLIQLSRGQITLTDPDRLERIATG